MLKARQGDLSIKKVDSLPRGLKEKKDNIIVSSSNNHELESGKVYEADNELIVAYLELPKKSKIVHKDKEGNEAEHNPIELAKGFYEVKRQREYLPDGYSIVED